MRRDPLEVPFVAGDGRVSAVATNELGGIERLSVAATARPIVTIVRETIGKRSAARVGLVSRTAAGRDALFFRLKIIF